MEKQVKIYEMPGCISCRLKFTLGKAIPFEAYFDGGIPDKNYPAVFATASVGQQLAIENSDLYVSGRIRQRKVKKSSSAIVAKPESKPSKVKDAVAKTEVESFSLKEYPEVETLVDAIALLKSEYGVSATRLRNEAGVTRVAEEKGVSFPNLKV